MSGSCLKPNEQYFSNIMARLPTTSNIRRVDNDALFVLDHKG